MENYDRLKRIGTPSEKDWQKDDAYYRAKKKLDKLKGFYQHLTAYVVINLFLIFLIGFKSGGEFFSFGTFSTAFFWGIGLAFHALSVFLPRFVFTKNWEDRKIKEFMDRDRMDL